MPPLAASLRKPRRTAGPPRRERLGGAERRDQILRVAKECFATRGFRGTTTRDVAAAVGITEAALYRYFESKEAIYTAILEERMAAPEAFAGVEPLAATGDDRAVFRKLALSLLGSIEADPQFIRLLFYSALEGHELARPFHEQRIRRFRDFITRYIARRVREGGLRAVDPDLAARSFIGMFVDYAIVRQVFGQADLYPQMPEQVADTYVSIFLDGIAVAKPGPRRARRPERG
jgi:AcrR family transcriptional regulator